MSQLRVRTKITLTYKSAPKIVQTTAITVHVSVFDHPLACWITLDMSGVSTWKPACSSQMDLIPEQISWEGS